MGYESFPLTFIFFKIVKTTNQMSSSSLVLFQMCVFAAKIGTQKGEELEADEEKAEAAKLGMGSLRDTERWGKSCGKPKEHDPHYGFLIYLLYIYIYISQMLHGAGIFTYMTG